MLQCWLQLNERAQHGLIHIPEPGPGPGHATAPRHSHPRRRKRPWCANMIPFFSSAKTILGLLSLLSLRSQQLVCKEAGRPSIHSTLPPSTRKEASGPTPNSHPAPALHRISTLPRSLVAAPIRVDLRGLKFQTSSSPQKHGLFLPPGTSPLHFKMGLNMIDWLRSWPRLLARGIRLSGTFREQKAAHVAWVVCRASSAPRRSPHR